MGRSCTDAFRITPTACFLAAISLLLIPLPWLLSAVIAAGVHELFHYGALRLLGGRKAHIEIGCRGAVLTTGHLSRREEFFCALAGPLGSFLLAAIIRILPLIGIFGLIQGCYNLLPVYPLDGGRALRCLTQGLPEPLGTGLCAAIETLVFVALWLFALSMTFVFQWGLLPIMIAGMLTIRRFILKNSLQTESTTGTIELL